MGETLISVEFDIGWAEYGNEDMADDEDPNPTPDTGWYISGTAPDGSGFDIGPDFYGPGCGTLDEALALIEKWAVQRGFHYARPVVTVRVVKPAVTPAADDWLAPGSHPAKAGTTSPASRRTRATTEGDARG